MAMEIIILLIVMWIYLRYLGPIVVYFKKTSPTAQKPTRAYGRAACWDGYSTETKVIPVGQWREISLGIAIAPWFHIYIPFFKLTVTPFGNIAYKLHGRSGLAIKKGLRNHLGIIDNDYRKELSAIVYNNGTYPVQIKAGDKICQIEFFRVPTVFLIERKKLSNSLRGEKGYGSSGK